MQTHKHSLGTEGEVAKESTRNASQGTLSIKEPSPGTSVKLINVLPTNDTIKSIGIQKETSKLEVCSTVVTVSCNSNAHRHPCM